MSEDRCICCYGPAPKGRAFCQDCQELFDGMPATWLEIETLLWRPFPLIEPKITNKEYLITSTNGNVRISLWDGYDWISTEDYFSTTDCVIAWTNLPAPYKPREEKSDG